MDDNSLIKKLTEKANDLKQSHTELNQDIHLIENWLSDSLNQMNTINMRLQDLLNKKEAADNQSSIERAPVDTPQAPTTIPSPLQKKKKSYSDELEAHLQGSLDALFDRLSVNIIDKMKRLRTTAGEKKVELMKEIQIEMDLEIYNDSNENEKAVTRSAASNITIEEIVAKNIDENLKKLIKIQEKKK